MTAQIKITQLADIAIANIAATTLLPVVNMEGVPTTQKATFGNIANVALSGAGSTFEAAGLANLAYSVVNAAQPNITSVGTLTTLTVSGNVNLGTIGNLVIGGGTTGDILTTDGSGNLSWSAISSLPLANGTSNFNISAVDGDVTITANGTATWTFITTGVLQDPVKTFNDLPSPSAGLRAFINDSNLAADGNFGSIISGGGGNVTPVFGDGTDWRIG